MWEKPRPILGSVGPYKLLEQIGEGGMGTVFLAEQTSPIRRRVALKIIKPGMDTKSVIARFEAERQALALMDHPHIARVFEAGSTDDGRPYFVMEHVKGERITEYCDRHRLPLRARLELFVDVCRAVQHAHDKGIIHRDLKPSNILVTVKNDKPTPKVIDFGVAKATNHSLTQQTLFTEQGQLVGTPEYMSPEQAEINAQDIDSRTDIYSLGIVLYELLVGALPFEPGYLRKAAFGELQRIIREEEPPRPSTRLSHLEEDDDSAEQRSTDRIALARQLRRDLDWITLKAIDKDRTRRYDTPARFADDLVRHLNDQPVEAGPPSIRYRASKWMSRNRGPLTTAAAVTLALGAGIVGTFQYLNDQDRTLSRHANTTETGRSSDEPLTDENLEAGAPRSIPFGFHPHQIHVLAVGISQYLHQGNALLQSLQFADKDAVRFHNAMRQLGVPEENNHVVTNEIATKGSIESAIERIRTKADKDDLVVLFWSGHGLPDRQNERLGFLPYYDSYPQQPATALSMPVLVTQLNVILGAKLIIADTCYSGRFGSYGAGGSPDPTWNLTESGTETVLQDTLVMTATSADEPAFEIAGEDGSTFTRAVVEGLSVHADGSGAHGREDQVVTFSELQAFVEERMQEAELRRGIRPSPQFHGSPSMLHKGVLIRATARETRATDSHEQYAGGRRKSVHLTCTMPENGVAYDVVFDYCVRESLSSPEEWHNSIRGKAASGTYEATLSVPVASFSKHTYVFRVTVTHPGTKESLVKKWTRKDLDEPHIEYTFTFTRSDFAQMLAAIEKPALEERAHAMIAMHKAQAVRSDRRSNHFGRAMSLMEEASKYFDVGDYAKATTSWRHANEVLHAA
jgi:serine/threonine protein kinase